MYTRQDQLQAYQYLARRIAASLLGVDPSSPEQPLRRATAATVSGVLVFVLAGGVVALVAFLTGTAGQV